MRLVVTKGPQPGLVFNLQEGPNVAGRDPAHPVHLPSAHVSRAHCQFDRRGSQVIVRDLDSRNGVFIEGQATRETVLRPGMRVQVGDWLLRFEPEDMPTSSPPQQTAPARQTPPPLPVGLDMDATGPVSAPPSGAPAPSAPEPVAAPSTGSSPFGTLPSAGTNSPFGAPSGGGFGGFGTPANSAQPQPSSATAPVSPDPVPQPAASTSTPNFAAGSSFSRASAAPPPPGRGREEVLGATEDSDWLTKLKGLQSTLLSGPWSLRFGAIFALLAFGVFLAPFGGVLSQILRTSDVAEQLAIDRAKALVLALDKRNMRPLAKGEQLGFDAEFVVVELGVKAALVTDERGVVRAPSDKVRSSISNKAYFNRARELGRVHAEEEDGLWHVLKPIRAQRVDGGPLDVVGWAYIMYDADEVVDEYIANYARVIVALLVILLLAGGGGFLAYRLVSKPLVDLREELELAMRGHVSSVMVDARWGDVDALAHSTNRLLERWREGGGDGVKLSPALAASLEGLPVPAIVTTATGTILSINPAASSWLRKDPSGVIGASITTLIPDAEFGAMLPRVCEAAKQSPDGIARERVSLSRCALTTVVCTDSTGIVAVTTAGE